MKMEDIIRSGGVLKKKSSSGCLIIKKKVENGNSGGGWEGLSSNSKERKRPRFVAGVSDEEEAAEFMRIKGNDKRLHNGSMGYRRSEFENKEYERSNVGIDHPGERRRSKLGSLEFDEYGEFDERRMREEYLEDRYNKMLGCRGGENPKDFVVGSSHRNLVADRQRGSYFDGSSSGRSKGGEHGGLRSKGFELEEDEAEMPNSLLRLKYPEVADEPIRLQGKNGVLKVMVNKKKRLDLHSHHNKYDPREVEERARSRSEDVPKRDLLPRMPIHPVSKPPENRGLWMEKEKMEVKLEKVKPKLSKGIKASEPEISGMSKSIKVKEREIDVTDTALKLAPPGLQASSSKKVVKKEEQRAPPENITHVKGKEGKVKRGGCTEKQMLREKIREMLIDSGWTIDYRPRRNRDYLDAVYINPSGTAYWSIIKAYDALKKQLDEDNSKSKVVVDSPSFAPLAEDLINKLTRQTKKKIEEEMKRKRKEDGLSKSAKRSSVRDAGESSDSDQNDERLSSCKKQNYKFQRGKFPDVDQGTDGDLSDDSPKRKFRKIKVEKNTTASNLNVLQGRTSKVIGRCTLLVRHSDRGENSESDGYVPYSGKRTVLAWLIDSGTAQLSEKVQYMNRRRNRAMLEGWITRDGIHCGCCSKILTVSKFELHAGSKLRQPFQNIFLESGPSLLQCQIDAWNRQGESICRDFHTVDVDGEDPDDDTCGICGDGGALICCDSCPSTFHQICLEIQMLPLGDWHCPNCICKFCGDASRTASVENNNDADELTRCNFCEEKYHKSCSKGVLASSMSSIGASFCGLKCQELNDHLQKILGVKHELEGGFSWSLIQRTDVSDTSHRGFPQRVESNSKLAVALSVMHECFLPVNDRRSGINMIRNAVYNIGSNFNRLNYCGFYTVILERGDEIVSAASIRIHRTRLAEMPFIGTREIYRRQGMCRRLLSAIEAELRYLEVEQLIIPAISEHTDIWTSVFGFHQLEDVLKKEIKSMNMLVFPGTNMLQKQLVKHSDGMKASESIKNQSQLPVIVEKSDVDSSMECEKQMNNDSAVGHDTKTSGKVGDLDSGFPAPAAPDNNNNNMAVSTSDSICEPNTDTASNGVTVVKSEAENNQKEPSSSSNGPPSGESNPPDESPVETVLGNTCTIEGPCLKSSISDSSIGTLVTDEASGKENHFGVDNVSEDADPQEFLPDSVLEASSPSATNGEDVELHSSTEGLANSAATLDPKAVESSSHNDIDDRDGCDGKVPCTERSLEASPEVSAEDVAEEVNENHSPIPTSISALIKSADTIATRNGEMECKADIQVQNDVAVSGEEETPHVVEGEAASSSSLDQTTASTGCIRESSIAAGENSR
ncbi:hypothetical protein C2S53_016680 [Perilla frutescens var. hirtella]|uniref:PHD-type domain-containing protein n=1 Tax=Perilla frutescens var. hirtella TaxID=608512 RepID=A0AAD4IU31_PERFH|nr:hypothetical protein C2S53_016680 [Perilla frutescens var. hirtella]